MAVLRISFREAFFLWWEAVEDREKRWNEQAGAVRPLVAHLDGTITGASHSAIRSSMVDREA